MKLALLGSAIQHSESPRLYRELLGTSIEYDLLDIATPDKIPPLNVLAQTYQGLNITSPYKTHFVKEVEIEDELTLELGAINVLALVQGKYFGMNTDILAVKEIMGRMISLYGPLQIILLGNGVMARLTKMLAKKFAVELVQVFSSGNSPLEQAHLRGYQRADKKTLVINACSRSFIFKGTLHPECIFWDYNYHFIPHYKSIPSQVLAYHDGQEMLRLQAQEAVNFWLKKNPKLKC